MAAERLDRLLASRTAVSRKDAGLMIRRGMVMVNDAVVKECGRKVDTQADRVSVGGKPVRMQRFVYYMMNKPAGALSASRDARAATVLDLLPPEMKRKGLFPAGRLDRDTEGLLLITNDGAFAHRMLAPKSHVDKQYEAVLARRVAPGDAARFAAGLALNGMVCLPAGLRILRDGENPLVLVTVREGKFHQVKRMFLALGNRVLRLRRVRIGGLRLDESLAPGKARELTERERESIFRGESNLYENKP